MPEPGERLTHLLVLDQVENRQFTRRGQGDRKVRDVERRAHGQAMQTELAVALAAQDETREEGSLEELEAVGVIISIEASEGFPLSLDSLEQLSRHRTAPRPKWLLSALPLRRRTFQNEPLCGSATNTGMPSSDSSRTTSPVKRTRLLGTLGTGRSYSCSGPAGPMAVRRRTTHDRHALVGGVATS